MCVCCCLIMIPYYEDFCAFHVVSALAYAKHISQTNHLCISLYVCVRVCGCVCASVCSEKKQVHHVINYYTLLCMRTHRAN